MGLRESNSPTSKGMDGIKQVQAMKNLKSTKATVMMESVIAEITDRIISGKYSCELFFPRLLLD